MKVNEYTTLAAWPVAVKRALIAEGLDPKPILEKAGVDIEVIERHPNGRVPIQNMTRLWQETEKASRNPAFGLKVANHVHIMNFSALGLLLITSKNIAEALDKVGNYHVLISNSVNIRLQHKPDLIGLTIEPFEGISISPMAIDAFFSSFIKHCQDLMGIAKLAERVELIRITPKQASAWKSFFECPVIFNAETNCLWMKRSILVKASPMGDSHLAAQNELIVRQYIDKMNALSWTGRAKQVIHTSLSSGEPTLSDVASLFNVSERTLSRHLKKEGSSFMQLLQEKRKELADYYLTQTTDSITEIAFNLGFTNTSNFYRAFQRWFGVAPSEYRNKSCQ